MSKDHGVQLQLRVWLDRVDRNAEMRSASDIKNNDYCHGDNTMSHTYRPIPYAPHVSVTALVAVASALSAPSALGQEGAKLEEVLVTATRRAETDVQSTAVAVTQVTADMVQRAVPRDLLDVAIYAPNVVAGRQPGFNSANFAIRGVG
ncbi:MAG: Plug domain-containing protein, partial [Cellvibrionales bacterium]